ncbi:ABC transporter ATP-binding protein [Candidatus Woesearchaeota archaeon]|nr:ABC transporter ATP-binding protein [Candidatus Woesearchaeota archaeon]
MDRSVLKFEDVWKIYGMGEIEVPALKGVSVQINQGDFIAIIGASGSGKSTMMNLIGCLDTPSKGSVYLKSKNISKLGESDLAAFRGKTIGFIFQQYNLIPSMTALENVLLPMEFLEYNSEESLSRANQLLRTVGLADKINNRPGQLSGGQQQRVAIARSLACDPEIILADEPTGSLDSVTGKEVLQILIKLWKEQGKTLIIVTHDINIAKNAETIIELKDGQITSISKLRGKSK